MSDIPLHQSKLLWYKSGGFCYICNIDLSPNNKHHIANEAHIYGNKPGSARYDATQKREFVNSFSNVLLLCANCHTMIDKDIDSYPVDRLFEIKSKHEKTVEIAVKKGMLKLSAANFYMLDELLTNINIQFDNKSISVPLDITEKIKFNSLSADVQIEITLGISQADVIRTFLNEHPQQNFASKLKFLLIEKYLDLVKSKLSNDDIYYELVDFSVMYSKSFQKRPVGIATIAYFFEACDVFES